MESFRSSSRPPKCTSHFGIGLVSSWHGHASDRGPASPAAQTVRWNQPVTRADSTRRPPGRADTKSPAGTPFPRRLQPGEHLHQARLYAKSTKSNGCPRSGESPHVAGAGRFLTVHSYPRHFRTRGCPYRLFSIVIAHGTQKCVKSSQGRRQEHRPNIPRLGSLKIHTATLQSYITPDAPLARRP